jgi:hypothetical protein
MLAKRPTLAKFLGRFTKLIGDEVRYRLLKNLHYIDIKLTMIALFESEASVDHFNRHSIGDYPYRNN